MKIETVFGKPVVRHQCDRLSEFITTHFKNEVNKTLNHPDVPRRTEEYKIGNSLTTCGLPHLTFTGVDGSEPLFTWIIEKVFDSAEYFGIKDPKGIIMGRNWINIQFENSTGVCHTHSSDRTNPTVVAIFYANCPANSADLVFIKNGRDKTMLDDYTVEDRHYMNVGQGELIIHDSTIYHTINVHKNRDPRVCFILELDYET